MHGLWGRDQLAEEAAVGHFDLLRSIHQILYSRGQLAVHWLQQQLSSRYLRYTAEV